MPMRLENYCSPEEWEKIQEFSKDKETPFLVVDLEVIRQKYQELTTCFPIAKVFYALKANPGAPVVNLLRELGSNFDIASIFELNRVLECGVEPDRISYGNTIKKAAHIKYAYDKGVRLFATDSKADLQNIAEQAPGSKIFVRILVEGGETAEWPLSRKFGCHPDMAIDLLVQAKNLGLVPYGISFHVGSQQKDIAVWDAALSKVKYMFDWMKFEEDVSLKMINMGGGFPANYISEVNPIQIYAEEILRYLHDDHGDDLPEIILEPGRSLVGESGVLVSEVVLISRKSRTDLNRWVYLDVGLFQGLIETLGEAIKYPIYTPKMDERVQEGTVVLAGPTCDSADIMYENSHYQLPLNLAVGDRLYWLTTGAYTNSYSSVEFNGFPPLTTYYLE
ncbi:ornithine decarboxylase [Alkanindiges hydrocarboniclasticus]|uniref:ornithine decarboxylase n=2 Tax=Alkanindiges hydrocarboniclasticus TaxID=1907941 RepID=A0A1S8CVT3_9GAMM|nr:type III PLP-dependent enzyme [Alkanindiges hydrocarboniclasticus]ONG41276.1 ornithine decarboxylase [Alkanindiges hydrocarboniclasticus]